MKETLIKYRLPIIIVAVIMIFMLVAVIVAKKNVGSTKNKNEYFSESIYPVKTTFGSDGSLVITLDGSITPDLAWKYENESKEIVKVKKGGKEKEGVFAVKATPLATGYATVKFSRIGKIGKTEYTAADITAQLLVGNHDDGSLYVEMSDIYQGNAYVGATDTKKPYLLSGNRILLPKGGDWKVANNENYDIYTSINDEGVRYIEVNPAEEVSEDTKDSLILELQSDKLGIKQDLQYRINEAGSGELKVLDEEE